MARGTPARSTKIKKSPSKLQSTSSLASVASLASPITSPTNSTGGLPRSPTKASVSSLRPGLGIGPSSTSLAQSTSKTISRNNSASSIIIKTPAKKTKRAKHSSDDPETSSVGGDGSDSDETESDGEGHRTPVLAWQRKGFGTLAVDEAETGSQPTTVDEFEGEVKRQNVVVCLR